MGNPGLLDRKWLIREKIEYFLISQINMAFLRPAVVRSMNLAIIPAMVINCVRSWMVYPPFSVEQIVFWNRFTPAGTRFFVL